MAEEENNPKKNKKKKKNTKEHKGITGSNSPSGPHEAACVLL